MEKHIRVGLSVLLLMAVCQSAFAAATRYGKEYNDGAPTEILLADRTNGNGVVAGKWHADLDQCKAFAEANGIPLVAVWSNGDLCHICTIFENNALSEPFCEWMAQSGIVFYFGHYGDPGKGSTLGEWCSWCGNDSPTGKRLPLVRLYWKVNGKVKVDTNAHGYTAYGTMGRCTITSTDLRPDQPYYRPGDYGTYNPGGRYMIDFIKNAFQNDCETERVGDYTWRFCVNGGEARICEQYGWSLDRGWFTSPAVSPSPTGFVEVPSTLGGHLVTSIGDDTFSGCCALEYVDIPGCVTNIGASAFYGCGGLAGVCLSDGLEVIGEEAFGYCCVLAHVDIPESVTSIENGAFANCANLSTVAFAGGMEGIDMDVFSAFAGTPWLESYIASLPPEDPDANTEEVGGYTWRYRINGDGAEIYGTPHWFSTWINEMPVVGYSCTPAVSPKPTGFVEVPDALGGYPVTSITEGAFSGCGGMTGIGLPDGLETIGDRAFENCRVLEYVEIPDSVVDVWERAFSGCNALTNVVIGSGVEEIDSSAFVYCGGLMRFEVAAGNPSYKSVGGMLLTQDGETLAHGVNGEVEVPAGVTEIGEGAFCGYGGLTGVRLPEGVEVIGDAAFVDCCALAFVELPDSLTRIGYWAFDGCSDALFDTVTVSGARLVDGWAVGATESLSAFLDLSGARGIGDGAFEGCCVLKYVEIPSDVTAVGNYSFYGCDGLKYVSLPEGMKSLGEGAFEDCRSLESISIPASVERIEWGAFYGCENLSSVTFKGDMAAIDMDVFSVFEGTPWLESYIATLPRPVNDDFTNATVIAGTSGSVTGSNAAATFEEDEPYDYGDHGTIWWRWTAPASGIAVFDTKDSGFNANTAVFTGDKLSELEEIAINGERQSGNCYAYTSRIEFEATKGVTYSIAVGGYEYGPIVLDWGMEPAKGSCLNQAIGLNPGTREVTLVNEYDPETEEFLDGGVCCFKVSLTKGREYTIGICGGDADEMELDVFADPDDENAPYAAFDVDNDVAYLYRDWWDEDDPSRATFYVCVYGEVGQRARLCFSTGIRELVPVDGIKVVPVSTTWLDGHTDRSATAPAANGRKVWECYVLGLDPEDAAADFKIVSLPMKADGTPDLANIVFEPTPDEWNMPAAQPVLKGAATLEGPWETVQDGNESAFRFFKVAVELP